MAMGNISWIMGALLLLIATVASASKTVVIDDNGIESVAEAVCKITRGSHTQIGRVSTIAQLVAYFKDLSPSHKLAACGEKYSDSINQLYQVVSQSNDNVCSEQKLALIEKFHHDFISRTWRDKKEQKFGKLVAPKMLILFFMHYTAEVSATCKRSMLKHQELSIGETVDPKQLDMVDGLLRDFSTKLGASPQLKSYDDITLLWNLADKFPLKEKDQEYLAAPDNRKRVFLKACAGEANQIGMLQRECTSELRPTYVGSILPLMRLADLGYYQDKDQFAGEIAGRPDLRRLIGIAQLCEAVLPVKVFKDESLQSDQMVFITQDEAKRMNGDEHLEVQETQDSTSSPSDRQNSLVDLEALPSVTPEAGHVVARSLRANIKSREKIFRRLFSVMSRQLRNKTKAIAGKLFFSSKTDKGYVRQDVTTVSSESSSDLPYDGHDRTNEALLRKKREYRASDIAIYILGPIVLFAEFLGNLFILWPIEGIAIILDKLFPLKK